MTVTIWFTSQVLAKSLNLEAKKKVNKKDAETQKHFAQPRNNCAIYPMKIKQKEKNACDE